MVLTKAFASSFPASVRTSKQFEFIIRKFLSLLQCRVVRWKNNSHKASGVCELQSFHHCDCLSTAPEINLSKHNKTQT